MRAPFNEAPLAGVSLPRDALRVNQQVRDQRIVTVKVAGGVSGTDWKIS